MKNKYNYPHGLKSKRRKMKIGVEKMIGLCYNRDMRYRPRIKKRNHNISGSFIGGDSFQLRGRRIPTSQNLKRRPHEEIKPKSNQ